MFRHSSCSAPSYKIKYVTDSIDHENRIMLDALGLTIIGFCFCFLLAFFSFQKSMVLEKSIFEHRIHYGDSC